MPSPRRRFTRNGEPVRRDTHARDAHAREHRAESESLPAGPEPEVRAEAAPAAAATDGLTPAASAPPAPEPGATPAPPTSHGGIEGRRTIVIGRTDAAAATRRSRPPRTAGERLGHRPDRIAAWAVALGLLLIVIAFATAGA
jgi:hypothetical protein